MTTLFGRTRLVLFVVLTAGLISRCTSEPPAASPLVYVSSTRIASAHRPSTDCAFRYKIDNAYGKLDNDSQRAAIEAGFALWQKLNPRVGFLELPSRPQVLVRFDKLPDNQRQPVTVGLLGGSAAAVSALQQASDGSYVVILSDAYTWDAGALTKAVAYQAGAFLGMATSDDPTSVMAPLFQGQPTRATRADSLAINTLYATPCKDLTSVSFLPLSLTVGGTNALVTKTIRFDNQGTIVIKATGQINVGTFVGISFPIGVEKGPFGFSPALYNIDPDIYHAALIYAIDNEIKANGKTNWHYWYNEQTFKTNGRQYIDLTFNVNDNTQSDDSGYYSVTVDYQ